MNENKAMKENYRFFPNRACEYFPCHEVEHPEQFNCMFCYCPLYTLGERCGGRFTYTEGGVKDCSKCLIPHRPDAHDYILSKWAELEKLAHKKSK